MQRTVAVYLLAIRIRKQRPIPLTAASLQQLTDYIIVMHPSVRGLAQHSRKPLINFLGKRKWPSTPEPPHAHPAAPQNVKDAFPDFVKKLNASENGASSSEGSKNKSATLYNEFWEAPSRYWAKNISEDEMEAITSGGASLH